MRQKVIISACLLGEKCRYDGNHNRIKLSHIDNVEYISACPEVLGGLSTPRTPAEMQNIAEKIIIGEGTIIDKLGKNVTSEFLDGANQALDLAIKHGVRIALLKSNSPSCGMGKVYDGTFSNQLIEGNGIFSEKCIQHKIDVISSDNIEKFKEKILKK
jgi:uncharacterized protein YbbK (DUF523 family)